MEFLSQFVSEGLNGQSVDTIRLYLTQLLLCGVVAIVINVLYKWKYKSRMTFPSVIIGLSLGIIVPFAKYSTPLALLALGVILFLGSGYQVKKQERPYLFVALFTILGVAAGFYVFALIGFTVGAVFLMLSNPKIEEAD